MSDVTVSLWLPVGRANFYSVTANGWLRGGPAGSAYIYSSKKLDLDGYVPLMQCSVLRRLLEVLPVSFGYDRDGLCHVTAEPDERARPVDVTMTLDLSAGRVFAPDSLAAQANQHLRALGVPKVILRVDEHGDYTFTAGMPDEGGEPRVVEAALRTHVGMVLGGSYQVMRHREQVHGYREGSAAIRRYNGLVEDATRDEAAGPPRGALTFFQLNTLVEGLFNQTLSPMVFFEQFDAVESYLKGREHAASVLLTIADIVGHLTIRTVRDSPVSRAVTLRHFLAMTSRESLQRLKWSVESVRRSLLDEMMAALHRQSRLIQLDLGAARGERTPELALDASESQLRGYVILAAAKLPLVATVHEIASVTVDHFTDIVDGGDPGAADTDDGDDAPLRREIDDLTIQLRHWKLLLDGIAHNIGSLETAVQQAWMERLLYEQEQARSEQEVMAEIERSRYGRASQAGGGGGGGAYNAMQLFFAAVAVLFAFATTDFHKIGDKPWYEQVLTLWPILVIAAVFYLVPAAVGGLWRSWVTHRGMSDSYSYEFAFRLDERTDTKRIHDHLISRSRKKVPFLSHRPLSVIRLGSGRIERVSSDEASVKIHSVATFRTRWLRFARFEIINEIIITRISEQPRYFLHQSRVFGVSPTPLPPRTVQKLLRTILEHIATPLALDGKLDHDEILSLVEPIYLGHPAGTESPAVEG
jgi:hypothetical protein